MAIRDIVDSLRLGNIDSLLESCYRWRPRGPGRPPHNPRGMLLSFVIMLVKDFHYRDMEDFLRRDQFWCRQLGFKKAPDHSCYTDFLGRLGPDLLQRVFHDLVVQLAIRGVLRVRTAVPDSFPLEAMSSDREAAWGWRARDGRVYGYRVHAVCAARSELPLAVHLATANVHDSVPFPELLEQILGFEIERVVADSAYDSRDIKARLVNLGIRPIIQKNPRRNPGPGRPQKKGSRRFRKRTAVERMFSRLVEFFHLRRLRWRGTERVASVVLIAFIGMLQLAVLGRKMGMSPRAVRSILRKLG